MQIKNLLHDVSYKKERFRNPQNDSLKWNFRISGFKSFIVNQNSQKIVKTFLLSMEMLTQT